MAKRVFIIDDEPDMTKIAADLLESDGYIVQSAENPTDGLKHIRSTLPDLVLLDIRLPELDGYEVCRQLKTDKKTSSIPIIMVSVKSDEADVVIGLELGAEDYIFKPFRKRELLARVKTAIRRVDPNTYQPILKAGPIHMDYDSYAARLNKKALKLTPKEFELLAYFIKRENSVLRRAAISENVWGVEFSGSTRTIDVHVDQLRRKLGKYGAFIKSLKGVGYRFEVGD